MSSDKPNPLQEAFEILGKTPRPEIFTQVANPYPQPPTPYQQGILHALNEINLLIDTPIDDGPVSDGIDAGLMLAKNAVERLLYQKD